MNPVVRYHRPAVPLRPVVQFYTQRSMRIWDPVFVHPVPARAARLMEFTFGDRIHVHYAGAAAEERSPAAVVVGMLTGPHARLRLQGTLESFAIIFRATGMASLFAAPLPELVGRAFDVQSVVGREINELHGRLGECRSFEARVAVADAFLARRLNRAEASDGVTTAAMLIEARHGRGTIESVASAVGIGVRQLERRFAERLGIRPKLYARMVRFQSALECKARSGASWTRVAHEFGFHDQMHLIHDFRHFTNGTPSETLRVMEGLFREQLALARQGVGATDARVVSRLVI